MTGVRLEAISEALGRALDNTRHQYGLGAGPLAIHYVPNPGGFVNHSFRVTAGGVSRHVKLATPEEQPKLSVWLGHAERLTASYHAPRVEGWIEITDPPLAGLVFAHIDGITPGHWRDVPLDDVAAVIHRLHQDEALAEELGQAVGPCRDTYLTTFDERFREDMKEIRRYPPPFVSLHVLDFLERETDALATKVMKADAFVQPARSPVHTDVWLNNVLVSRHEWTLLDWDDLTVGDPALDAAMVGGPALDEPVHALHRAFANEDTAFKERVPVYQRAYVLDWCIDVLADYIEASRWLDDASEVCAEKQSLHERALQVYARRYRGP